MITKPEFDFETIRAKIVEMHNAHPSIRAGRANGMVCGMIGSETLMRLWVGHYQGAMIAGKQVKVDELLAQVYAQIVRDSFLLVDQVEAANLYIEPASNLLVPQLAVPDPEDPPEGG